MKGKEFEKAVIIFIDVLGTQDRKEFNEWYKITDIFYDTVQSEKELDKNHEHVVYKREIHVFSDCAYIVYDYKDWVEEGRKNDIELMITACYNTEKVLYEFYKNGFVVRGAITYGYIYYEVDRGLYFGPAMNRAFELESKIAIYPRVIIDPNIAGLLFEYNESKYRKDKFTQMFNGEIIKRDADGMFFLNVLDIKYGMNMKEREAIIDKLLTLCIEERNKKRENERIGQSIREKYDWLEKYVRSTMF